MAILVRRMPVRAVIEGVARPAPDDNLVRWVCAAPPDRMTSFSGSALPFSSQDQAFHDKQSGVARVGDGGRYVIELEAPNSYHLGPSEHPVPPQVIVDWTSGGETYSATASVWKATEPGRSLRRACGDREESFGDVMTQEDYLASRVYAPPGGRVRFVP